VQQKDVAGFRVADPARHLVPPAHGGREKKDPEPTARRGIFGF
jgi:hypothetical protein